MSVPRRRFGSTPVHLSTIAYGTMRLVAPRFEAAAIEALFLDALDRGITTFHVSHEYASYPAVCAALARARAARPSIACETIAKIAVPHFDETAIAPGRLRGLIERTLRDLSVARIEVVQWLVRATPNDDGPRLAVLDRDADAFARDWETLRTQGAVGALGVFPYSDAFLRRALDLPFADGVVSYYNAQERELEPFFDELRAAGRGAIGIRPLGAGAVRGEREVGDALRAALAPAAMAATIVGLSSADQVRQAAEAAATDPVPPSG